MGGQLVIIAASDDVYSSRGKVIVMPLICVNDSEALTVLKLSLFKICHYVKYGVQTYRAEVFSKSNAPEDGGLPFPSLPKTNLSLGGRVLIPSIPRKTA